MTYSVQLFSCMLLTAVSRTLSVWTFSYVTNFRARRNFPSQRYIATRTLEKGDKSHLDVAKEFSVAKSTVRLLCSRKVQLESMQLSLL